MAHEHDDKNHGWQLLTACAERLLMEAEDASSSSSLAVLKGISPCDTAPSSDDLCAPALGAGKTPETLFMELIQKGHEEEEAVLAALQLRALAACDDTMFFHYWMSGELRSWFGPRGFEAAEKFATLRQRVQDMITMGINLRGRRPEEYLAARQRWGQRSESGSSEFALVFDALLSAASFAGAGLLETMDVLVRDPICPRAGVLTFARLAGLFYGRNRLLNLRTLDRPFHSFLAS